MMSVHSPMQPVHSISMTFKLLQWNHALNPLPSTPLSPSPLAHMRQQATGSWGESTQHRQQATVGKRHHQGARRLQQGRAVGSSRGEGVGSKLTQHRTTSSHEKSADIFSAALCPGVAAYVVLMTCPLHTRDRSLTRSKRCPSVHVALPAPS